MARYRIHEFDADDHVKASDTIDCTTDDEALLAFGDIRVGGHAVELWLGRRLLLRRSAAAGTLRTGRLPWPRL